MINHLLRKSVVLKISGFFLVVILVFSWIFSGWPRIWEKPAIPPKIQEAQAATMDYKKGSFTKNTSTGSQSITGVGFQPKAIIFYWTNQTTEGTLTGNGYYGFGFTSGSTAERAISSWSDAGASSDTGKKGSQTYCIMFQLADGADGGTAELTSFDADGFTLNWVTANASAYIIHYIALAGSDLTNAQAGTFDMTTATGEQAVIGIGFQPEFVMFLSATIGTTYDTNSAHSFVSIGFATDANNEGAVTFTSRDAQAPAVTYSQQRTDASILSTGILGGQQIHAELVSMDADGFTLNKISAPGATQSIFYLALKGGQYKVGNFTQGTSTGNQQTTGVGFQPVGLFMDSFNAAAGTAIIEASSHSSGAAQSSTARGYIWEGDTDALASPDPDIRTLTSTAIGLLSGDAATLNAEADFVSFDADGFTLNWTTADATARQIIYWAIGEEAVLPPAFNQSAYRWFQNMDSDDVIAVKSHPSTGNDRARAIAIDTAGGVMYVVGIDYAPGASDSEIRIEKRYLSDGSFVSAFGANGATTTNPVIGDNDQGYGITIDTAGGVMYVAAHDSVPGNDEWRIEKRYLSDGSFVSGFGTNGVVTSNPSANDNDHAFKIAIDTAGGVMYVVGQDAEFGSLDRQWRIEKRYLSDGSFVSGFGTNGAITTNPSAGMDIPYDIAIDTSGGVMYVAGQYRESVNNSPAWRIEKRNLSDGSLVSAFGASGVVTSNPSTGQDLLTSIEIDISGGVMYLVGGEEVSANQAIRIEKRYLSDGSFVTAFGTNGATTTNPSDYDDGTRGLAIDTVGGVMYVAGHDSVPGETDQEIRIEKRNLSDGSLVSAFGASGVVTSNPSGGDDRSRGIAIDTAGGVMYVAGYDSAPGNMEWRVEKRNLSDGTGALAAQNTAATLGSAGAAFRLRMLLHVGTSQLAQNGENFKLQFAQRSGTCDAAFDGETYADVTAATVIAYNNNATPADGDNLAANSDDPTHGTDTIVNQDYEELNNFTNSVSAIPSGQDGKWDFSLKDNGAAASTAYCFRAVKSDDTDLDTYTVIPQITTAAPSLTFSISDNAIGFSNLDSANERWATGDGAGSATEVSAHTINASTNGASGYVITVNGSTLTSGANTITAIGATAANVTLGNGTEQFGIRLTASGGNGAVSAPYNGAANNYALDTAAFPDQIASDPDGDDVATTYSVFYAANIAGATEAGSYTSTLTYIATGTF